MATIVCQNVQSRFEPWLTKPPGAGFEFSLPKTLNPKPETPKGSSKKEGYFGGWSFLQALSNITNPSSPKENDKVYVHPLVKKASSMLSEKSLEMCTESLGSETGSNMSENGDDLINSLVFQSERPQSIPCFGERKRWGGGRRGVGGGSFPPPLTTIRGGGGGVRVESEREDGRLVLKAVSVEAEQGCFKAERRGGRLRLHLVSTSSCASLDDDDDHDYDDNHDYDYDYVRNINGDYDEYDHVDDVDDGEEDYGKGIEENSGCFGGEIQMGSFRRPKRCKDNSGGRNKEMLNWEQFWVATS